MSRVKSAPYLELGRLLETWRKPRYRSARALFQGAKLSVSYSLYADFERGVKLPGVEFLIELADALAQDPETAVLTWAKVQMPTPKLRALFERRAEHRRTAPDTPRGSSVAPSFENTWVLGPEDRALLLARPALWTSIQRLAIRWPNAVPTKELASPESLGPWVAAGRITETPQGFALRLQHVHIPQTPEWHEVRANNLAIAFDDLRGNMTPGLLEQGEACRELIHRTLTPSQARRWVQALRALEREFRSDPYVAAPGNDTPTYALLLLLGPRTSAPK